MIRIISLLFIAVLLAPLSYADIFVDRAIVRLGADKPPRDDIKVINNGTQEGYVQVEVFEVLNPGTENEQRVPATDPDNIRLLATPTKLVVPAGGQKSVRIVNLEPGNNEERIYRINVTPVLPPLTEEEGSVVRVVVAYQLLVIVDPDEPKENLDIQRSGFRLTVRNNGNTNVLFSDGRQCDKQGENCVEISAHRVYPGNTWQVDLEKDQPATFKLTSFNGIREITTK